MKKFSTKYLCTNMQTSELSLERLMFDPSSVNNSKTYLHEIVCVFYERLLKRYSSYVDEKSKSDMQHDFEQMIELQDSNSMWQFLLCGMYMDVDLIPILNKQRDVKFLNYMSKVIMPKLWGGLVGCLASNPNSLMHCCNVLYNMWSKDDILTSTLPIVVRPIVQTAKAEAPPPAGSTAVYI